MTLLTSPDCWTAIKKLTTPTTMHGDKNGDWFILSILLASPRIWFSFTPKPQSHKQCWKKVDLF